MIKPPLVISPHYNNRRIPTVVSLWQCPIQVLAIATPNYCPYLSFLKPQVGCQKGLQWVDLNWFGTWQPAKVKPPQAFSLSYKKKEC